MLISFMFFAHCVGSFWWALGVSYFGDAEPPGSPPGTTLGPLSAPRCARHARAPPAARPASPARARPPAAPARCRPHPPPGAPRAALSCPNEEWDDEKACLLEQYRQYWQSGEPVDMGQKYMSAFYRSSPR